MGQAEIYNFLNKHKGEWFTTKQMSKELKLNSQTIAFSAAKLVKFHEIERKLLDVKTYLFRIKKAHQRAVSVETRTSLKWLEDKK